MRYLLVSLASLVVVFLSVGCTTPRQPALHDFGLPGSTSTHEGKPVMKPVVIARDGVVYAASPPGAGTVIARDGVYAASPPGAGAVIARDGVYAASPPGAGAVSVGAPTWLWDNRIRYRLLYETPTQVRFYGLDMWIAPPPELFEQMLVSSIKTLNYSLNIQLLEFEQQFDASDRARVVLRFSVDAYSGDNKQKIGTQEFHLEQSTKTPDAAGAVSGFTDLTQQAVGRIQNWLAGLS
jgi:cholesterol transport system auxiliary component